MDGGGGGVIREAREENQASNQIKARERDQRLMEPPPSTTSGDAPDEGADVLPGELLPDLDPSSVRLSSAWAGCKDAQHPRGSGNNQPVRSFCKMGGTIQELFRNILLPVLLSVHALRHRPPPCSQSLLGPYLVTFSPSLPLTSTCLRGRGGTSPQRAEKSACSPVLIQPPSGDGGFDRDKGDGGLRVKDSDNMWLNAN